MLQRVGLTNIKTQILEVSKHTEIYNAPKPIDPARGLIAFHSHGNELLDFARTTTAWTCEARTSTHCDDPVVLEMIAKALPLTGDEREKALQAIAKYNYDQAISLPILHPTFYFAMSKRLEWTPRTDGFVLVKEMKLKE